MPFGLGLLELLMVLGVLAAPLVLIVLGLRFVGLRSGGRPPARELVAEQRHLLAELESTRDRLEAVEERLASAEEKLAFNQRLLEAKLDRPQ